MLGYFFLSATTYGVDREAVAKIEILPDRSVPFHQQAFPSLSLSLAKAGELPEDKIRI